MSKCVLIEFRGETFINFLKGDSKNTTPFYTKKKAHVSNTWAFICFKLKSD